MQQLHGEFDFTDAAAPQLHVVGAFRSRGTAALRLQADLLVQHAQRLEHVVVEVAAKHKRRDDVAQSRHLVDASGGCHHPRLQPRQPLPLTPLHLEIFFQGLQGDDTGPRFAVRAQRQIHAKHKAVLGGVANQGVNLLHHPIEKHLVVDHATAIGQALRLTVFVIHINQVDVAGHIQLGRAQLAHAHDPQLRHNPLRCARQAMAQRHPLGGELQGLIKRELGQPGHGLGHHEQGCLLFAIKHHQTLHHQLAQHPQGVCRFRPSLLQGLQTKGQAVG